MAEYIEQCIKCFHFQVCAQVMKNWLFIREKMLKEENPKCEHFIPAADVAKVVRCKYCKDNATGCVSKGTIWCVRYHAWRALESFCSYGEQREESEEIDNA